MVGIEIPRFGEIAMDRLRDGDLIIDDGVGFLGWMKIVCKDKLGRIKWEDEGPNIVVNTGLIYFLQVGVNGAGVQAQINPFFVGLTDGTPTVVAGDTHASHGGWVEVTDYAGTDRLDWGEDNAATNSVTNTTSVDFAMDATVTVGGAYLTEDQPHATTSGILLAARAFTGGDQAVDNGDTLAVTYTINATTS